MVAGRMCATKVRNITIRGRENQLSIARTLICYWGSEYLGLPGTRIAVRLKMSQQAASKALLRGKAYCLENDLELKIL